MGKQYKLIVACSVFASIFILAFSPIIFKGEIIAPANELYDNPFFKIDSKAPSQKPGQYDSMLAFLPWFHFDKEALKALSLPLWDPYQGCGVPHIANMQSSFFYPLNIFVYIFNWRWGLFFLYFFKFFLVGLFAYLYLSEIGIDYRASIVASIAAMYSGSMHMFQYPASGIVFCFFLGLWSIELIMKYPDEFKGYGLLLVAFVIAVFAGHPEMLFFMTLVFGIYFLRRLLSEQGLNNKAYSTIGKTALFIFIGILISSIQSLPFLEYLHYSSVSLFRSSISDSSFYPLSVVVASSNNFFARGTINANTLSHVWLDAELNYIGLPMFVFGVSGIIRLWRNKYVRTMSVLLFITFIVPFNVPLIHTIVSITPLLDISQKEFLWAFSGFCLIIIGALYLDKLFRQEIEPKTTNVAIYITLGLTSALLIIHSKYYTLTNVKLVVIIIIALSVAVAFLVRLKNNTTKAIFIGIVVFVTTGLGKSMYSGGEYKYFYPTNPIIDRIQRTPGHFRSIAIMKNDLEAWGANINTFYDIEDVRNNDSIGITWYNKFVVNQIYEPDILNFLNVKYIVVPEGIYYTKILSNKEATFSHHYDIGMGMSVGSFKPVMEYNGFTLYENPRAFNRAFMVYDYKIADTHGEAFDLVRRYAPQIGRTAVISREAARYASFVPGDTMTAPASDVSFEEYAPNRIKMRVDTSSPGLLVISNTYFPGWHAYIDGRGTRVIRADYAFQGVFVPGGRHEVRLDYMPLSFVIGLILSLAGLAAIPLMYVLL